MKFSHIIPKHITEDPFSSDQGELLLLEDLWIRKFMMVHFLNEGHWNIGNIDNHVFAFDFNRKDGDRYIYSIFKYTSPNKCVLLGELDLCLEEVKDHVRFLSTEHNLRDIYCNPIYEDILEQYSDELIVSR